RAEVDGVIGRSIHAMKRHTHEALPLNVLAFDSALDRAVAELDASHVRHALARACAETQTLSRPVTEATHGAVEDLQVLGLEGSLLGGNAGSRAEAGRSKHGGDGNAPAHRVSFRWSTMRIGRLRWDAPYDDARGQVSGGAVRLWVNSSNDDQEPVGGGVATRPCHHRLWRRSRGDRGKPDPRRM